MTEQAVNWNTILLALIAAIPGIIAAYYAAQARETARTAATLSASNGVAIEKVATQTDGLATQLGEAKLKEGYATGVKTTTDTATAHAMQRDMLKAAVAEGIASYIAQQPTMLTAVVPALAVGPSAPAGPSAQDLALIKTAVEDTAPRVVAIESATVAHGDAQRAASAVTDERLTRLEHKETP